MNKVLFIFVLAALFSLNVFSQTESKKKVAVYVTGSDVEESYKKVIGAKMVSFITKSQQFSAVERTADFLSALNSEQDYQTSGEVSNSQIVKLGNQFGARYVAVLDLTNVLDELFVSSRMIDVQTGQIISSFDASSTAENMAQLTALANKVSDGLILEPIRAIEAMQKADKEKKLAEERNRQQQLREKAIQNLMPSGTIRCGSFIVINRKIPVSFTVNPKTGEVSVITPIPQGFKMADAGVLEYIHKYRGFWNESSDYYIANDILLKSRNKDSFNKKKGCGTWMMYQYKLDRSYLSSSYFNAVRTDLIGNTYSINWISGDISLIAYRDFFTEAEIQAEINRISR